MTTPVQGADTPTINVQPTTEPPELPPRLRPQLSTSILWQAERVALPALLIVVLVVFSIPDNPFATANNFRIVLGNQAVLGLVALASIVPLIGGQFDLSVGAIMGTSSIVCATTMSRFHLGLAVGVMFALLSGLIIGLVNGTIVSRVGVNPLIVTLATATVLQGVVQWYTNGTVISGGISLHLIDASSGNLAGVPKGLIWLLPVAAVLWYVLGHTPWGRYVGATGSNSRAARLAGLRVNAITLATFLASGTIAALAGVLQTGVAGAADPQAALGAILLPALAAAFLGSSAFAPGRFNVPGTLVAVYFVAFAVSGFQFLGAATWIQQLFNGLALLGAVTLSTLLGRRKGRLR